MKILQIYRRATWEDRGRPSLTFLENRRECPGFGKKGPDCVYL